VTDHEPECYYGEPVRGGHILDCVCDRLRAHGDRIRAATIAEYEATWQAVLARTNARARLDERRRCVDRLQAAIDNGSQINAVGCVQLLKEGL